MDPVRQEGGGLLLVLAAIALAALSAGALALSSASATAERVRASDRALAQARDALVAHAADRPIDARVGPGYLPCPDLDDDGWAEPTCGSLDGRLGQAERLGRLPWKTLGLPDLRDGHGERLWYAVSTRFKGLLNCAASPDCVAMTPPAALGTITVRDAAGAIAHDGTLADPARAASGGAAAVVIAPGPARRRHDGHEQRRDCPPGECDTRGRCLLDPPWRVPRCDPRNYLDAAGGEDNADFHDRGDAAGRAGNANGFIQGPVPGAGGRAFNDRIAAVSYPDVMARVMARVGLELAHCLRARADAAAMPAEPCAESPALGRVPDDMLAAPGCNAGPAEGWWRAWRPHVLYARAGPPGLDVVDARGILLAPARRFAILVTQRAGECGQGRLECDAGACYRVVQPVRSRDRHDALVAVP